METALITIALGDLAMSFVGDFGVYISVFGIMIVPSVYLFNWHVSLIIKGNKRKYFTGLCVILAIAGLIVLLAGNFEREYMGQAVGFISPVVHLYIFKGMYAFFVSRVGREPRDVYENWEPGLFKDRVFAFAVWVGFICSSLFAFGFAVGRF